MWRRKLVSFVSNQTVTSLAGGKVINSLKKWSWTGARRESAEEQNDVVSVAGVAGSGTWNQKK